MGVIRHACKKCAQGGSFASQIHQNERRFDSLSGKFETCSSASRTGSTLISVSLCLDRHRFFSLLEFTHSARDSFFRGKVNLKMIDDAEFLFSQPGRWPIFGGLPTCWAWAEWDCSYTARPLPTISEKSKQNALKALSDGQISPFRRQ
jgi:hypothetical protein